MRRSALGALAALVFVGLGVALTATGSGGATGTPGNPSYWVELDNAFGLVQGGDMKVAGVRAGSITAIDLDRSTLHALVHFKVTEDGFGSLRADVTCQTRPQSLIGEYYLDCEPGNSPTPLKPGSVIPVTSTSSTVAPDLITDIFRLPYRQRLQIIINELGAGAAGNAANLRAAIRRASPALQETDQVLAILAKQDRTLADLARDGDRVLGALAANRRDVGRFVQTANATTTAAASQKAALAAGIRRLPGFLAALQPAMSALGDVAANTTPALRNLDASAAQLKTLLDRLGPFATASRPAFRALGKASTTGRQALTAAAPTVKQLTSFAVPTPELAKNLNIVLQHLDDRAYAVEKDPRSPGGQGFTGLEALLNYVLYQATATNTYDADTHLLNIDLMASLTCTPYPDPAAVAAAAKDPANNPLAACRSWLGPSQPGITTPDPTATSANSTPRATTRPPAPAATPQPVAPTTTPANPNALQNTTPTSTAPAPAPTTPQDPLSQLVSNLVNGLPSLLGQRSAHLSQRSEKQLLDYLLAP